TGDAHLHKALQSVTRQRSDATEDRNQHDSQRVSPFLRRAAANKKLLAPLGSQESSEPAVHAGPAMANSIAFIFPVSLASAPTAAARILPRGSSLEPAMELCGHVPPQASQDGYRTVASRSSRRRSCSTRIGKEAESTP